MLRSLFSMCVPAQDLPMSKVDPRGRDSARVTTLPSRYCVRAITDVAITSSSTETQGSDVHVVYRIVVSRQGERWTVLRRYRQFLELHNKLVQLHACTLQFPERVFFQNRDRAVVEQREAALNVYLKALLADAKIKDTPEFRTFVGADADGSGSKYTQFSYAYRSGRKLLSSTSS
ncbi:hypothetical protein SPRG_04817 [Saprolegnia parasitica CBS 223.65]|uniref:PX domain-containing protein n=1 Tax=Saprolegnia parasitica (strain CBS 223.65) TaxID=695850 RepID=A0A067CJJ2_SAPPC|nr:hypothetical protein SPRG_04817 [Saprolegnia parasitica CBS 223.65]KDO30914.1 hypothetical protein SPRG_04817 [Saprolegnia parasitica CBS 223.65]|eukprot:XP_012198606.1 hypothetical protein SPRG_04817 [Saprolegnia parasitica CBS 223.65]